MARPPASPDNPLVQARLSVDLDQREAARRLGLPANTLGRYERGERQAPTKVLTKMAAIYGVSVGSLIAHHSVGVPAVVAQKSATVPDETGGGNPALPLTRDGLLGALWLVQRSIKKSANENSALVQEIIDALDGAGR